MVKRVIVCMTGATGQAFGIRMLDLIQGTEFESHLIISKGAKLNIAQEAENSIEDVQSRADTVYQNDDIGAPPASGSFTTEGMLVSPCSMKTLSNIAHGNAGNLITRAADVTLKERRPLVLLPREKPFNRIHLKNMLEVTDAGGIIMPPFPSFYDRPTSIDEMVTRTAARSLAFVGVPTDIDEWEGIDPDR